LGQCKNWRGICLLDIASKIFSSILVARLQTVQEAEGLEAQAGFRANRGTIDGLYASALSLLKRREHGLDTWVLFIDLIKAFDTVPREALFAVLKKFGLPPHFISMLVRLHDGAVIRFKIGETEAEVGSRIGVRQGSCEGPSLFLFIIQAALETMEWPVDKPTFCTREGGRLTGENPNHKRGRTLFELWSSLFADDCELLFNNRSDLTTGANYLFLHLASFGLHMHIGRDTTASKTEAMFVPGPNTVYTDGDTSDFTVSDGFVSFTTEFKYLGSVTHYSLKSDTDVDLRIKSASAAFGALRECIFTHKDIRPITKGKTYVSLVLTILLYGSECWCLRKDLLDRLRVFHHRCVRDMCRVTLRHTHKHHISTATLLTRLDIHPIDTYYNQRLLRWAGHVARMQPDRVPRKLMTSWVAHSRPHGCPQMTWGRTVHRALESCNISTTTAEWFQLAQSRAQWRALIREC
jgi:hypothetical protein